MGTNWMPPANHWPPPHATAVLYLMVRKHLSDNVPQLEYSTVLGFMVFTMIKILIF